MSCCINIQNIFKLFFRGFYLPGFREYSTFANMTKYITALTIAGSDCSGGAGIQADIKTFSALGCYAASVITAVTVQNTCGVTAVHPIPADIVEAQIRSVTGDLLPAAIKIGMVTDGNIIEAIARSLENYHTTVVFDPVLVSSSGHPLIEKQALELLRTRLLPLCTLLTPNIPEAEALSDIQIRTDKERVEAGQKILASGCRAVLIKGGHLPGNDMEDVLLTAEAPETAIRFHGKRITSHNTHGTGCTLSSAITAYIARGYNLADAVKKGKEYLTHALIAGKDIAIGNGCGPLNHFFDPTKLIIR